MDNLKTLIREVPDFPKQGILFYDITTLLKDRDGLRGVVDGLKSHYSGRSRYRYGHRSPRVYIRAGSSLCAECRLRPGAETQETAGSNGQC